MSVIMCVCVCAYVHVSVDVWIGSALVCRVVRRDERGGRRASVRGMACSPVKQQPMESVHSNPQCSFPSPAS
ncbi:hypothetical protein BCV69DRAFT_76762 [Microstroma glucosiphilum]|uniref:Uncharacterized protein n=1 Tax=Pseudomicrostroma glucosiphilum TaxID=1684307 RepID=A0A316U0X9_9BASI|nr:hypothetical protein BCV69DRAFT_76762 [Pseudomicrostroma glucosiphilum]PWN18524.1 hypothetical protein BCV69DRAFT_76762 [Pseudomicrostroma glucosiphilum]